MASSSTDEPKTLFNRAILQILLAHKCLEEDDLVKYVDYIKNDYLGASATYSLRDIFAAINPKLRDLSLEIKSVAIKKDDSNAFTYYHGVVNNEEDYVSKEHGNYFDTQELKYFSMVVTRLLSAKSYSTSDIIAFKPYSAWTNQRIHHFLDRLIRDKWLTRNDRNHIVIGPRSYLELRSYLETALQNKQTGDEEDADNEPENDADIQTLIHSLPSNILY